MTREIHDMCKGKPTKTIMTFYYRESDVLEIHLLPLEKYYFEGFDYGSCLLCITEIN